MQVNGVWVKLNAKTECDAELMKMYQELMK